MFRRSLKRLCGVVLTLAVMMGMFAFGNLGVSVSAADKIITVSIEDVTRCYKDAKTFFDMINEYRTANKLTAWKMDKDSLEAAMLRASELSIYVSEYTPSGNNGLSYLGSVSDAGQLIGYDVRSLSVLLNDMKSGMDSNGILLDRGLKSVGVGVITVRGYKFVCVLASDKNPTTVADSVLTQSNVKLNQDVKIKTSLLSDVKSPYTANPQGVSCGSGIRARLIATNTTYPTVSVYLTADYCNITFSDPKIFSLKDGLLFANTPGLCTVSIYFSDAQNIGGRCYLQAVGKTFSSCRFASIPDQYYTGNPVTPAVTITDSDGNALKVGTDYSLSYSNNVNIGTATVTITGMGTYAGEKTTMNFNIVKGSSTTALALDVFTSLSNLSIGQSTTLTAQASGGKPAYKYTYSYAPYGTSNWTVLVSNTSASTYTLKPTKTGRYYFRGMVVDTAGSQAFRTAVIYVNPQLTCKASLSSSSIPVSSTVNIRNTAAGGVEPFTYAFYAQKPGSSSWICLRDFGNGDTYSFKPTAVGTYKICTKVKSGSGVVAKDYIDLTVTGSTLGNLSTVSATTIDLGQSVKVRGNANNGTAPYNYAYYYKYSSDKSWKLSKDYSTTTSVSIKPARVGTYSICVKVKDSKNVVVKKYFSLTVLPKPVNNSTVTPSTIGKGSSVQVKCSASSGSGTYQYAVFYKRSSSSSYTKARDYASGTSVSIKPAYTGKYDIRVKVKDTTGMVVNKDFVITVNPALTNTSKLSATTVKKGKAVSVTCSATGGVGSYQYAVYYKQKSQSSWTKARDYASGTSVSITPKAATKYDVRVKVKDSSGKVINKDLTLTATS